MVTTLNLRRSVLVRLLVVAAIAAVIFSAAVMSRASAQLANTTWEAAAGGKMKFVVTSTLVVIVGDGIIRALMLPAWAQAMWQFAKWPFAAGLLLLGFAATYHFAPDLKRRKWHWITPGSILAVLLLMLVSIGLRIYLHFMGDYTATYGALGGVIVLLLCFYLGGVAVLVGGVLNGTIEQAKRH